MYGHAVRFGRLFPPEGRRLFAVPLDHSVSMGPIEGLESTAAVVEELQEGGADLLIVTKGAVRETVPHLRPRTLLGIHLSASTSLGPTPDAKVLVGSAPEASALGADLVSVQVNFGVPEEPQMLTDLGRMADGCHAAGLPLLCMAYVRGRASPTAEEMTHAARASADLGADLVKTSYTGSAASFARLVRSVPVPVLLGGGVRMEDPVAAIARLGEVLDAGAAGVCVGRNLFQRRPLAPFVRQVGDLVHAHARRTTTP